MCFWELTADCYTLYAVKLFVYKEFFLNSCFTFSFTWILFTFFVSSFFFTLPCIHPLFTIKHSLEEQKGKGQDSFETRPWVFSGQSVSGPWASAHSVSTLGASTHKSYPEASMNRVWMPLLSLCPGSSQAPPFPVALVPARCLSRPCQRFCWWPREVLRHNIRLC